MIAREETRGQGGGEGARVLGMRTGGEERTWTGKEGLEELGRWGRGGGREQGREERGRGRREEIGRTGTRVEQISLTRSNIR